MDECVEHHAEHRQCSFLVHPSVDWLSQQIVLFIAITDLLDCLSEGFIAIVILLGIHSDYRTLCVLQGIGTHIGSISSLLWTVAASYLLNQIMEYRFCTSSDQTATTREVQRVYTRMHCVIWSLTALCTVMPVVVSRGDLSIYGWAEGHCWIVNYVTVGKICRFVFFYGPLWLANVYMSCVSRKACKFMHRAQQTQSSAIRNMRGFPLILICCYSPATVFRIYGLIDDSYGGHNTLVLRCITFAGITLTGFFDGILYGCLRRSRKPKSADMVDANATRERPEGSTETGERHSEMMQYPYDHVESHPHADPQVCFVSNAQYRYASVTVEEDEEGEDI